MSNKKYYGTWIKKKLLRRFEFWWADFEFLIDAKTIVLRKRLMLEKVVAKRIYF